MARIYPVFLPPSITEDPGRKAEWRVYSALKTLPDKYTVFYSVYWQKLADQWAAREGEADFVIVHPEQGIVILEVKGGGILYKPDVNEWYSYERNGTPHLIKDPVEQGRKSHYALLDQLKSLPGWLPTYINIGHAVCFPDIFLNSDQSLKPDLPRALILDSRDVDNISASLLRLMQALFAAQMSSGAPGPQRMQMVEGWLARSFELRTPLGIEIEYEDQKLVELTEQQYFALSLLGERKRAAIGGCAGSGKTMLALHKAAQFAKLDLSVLLTCYNAPLANYLQARLPNADAINFHELCRRAAAEAWVRLPAPREEQDYYHRELPQALLEAAEKLGRIYDAIIVDEAQDFREDYWIALEPLLKEDGRLFAFFDDNQNLYGGALDFGGLIKDEPYSLTFNCRNTQAIHRTVARFHHLPEPLRCPGPQGNPPEVLCYQGEEEGLRLLQKTLHRLVVTEHIHPADIVVLTPRGQKRTRLAPGLRLGNFQLTIQPSTERNQIQAVSVHLFKGLEKRVVILTELDSRVPFNIERVLYVGCSRARTYLVILHDTGAPPELIRRLSA